MNENHLIIFGRRVMFCTPEGETIQLSEITPGLKDDSIDVMGSRGTVLCRFYRPLEDKSKLYLTHPKTTRVGSPFVRIIRGTEECHEPVEYRYGIIALLLERESSGETEVTVVI